MRKCEVIFAYHPVNPDELQLNVGEIIEIVREVESRRQHSDPRCSVWIGGRGHALMNSSALFTQQIEDGWWMGVKNGGVGAFPSNFVSEIFVSPKGLQRLFESSYSLRTC